MNKDMIFYNVIPMALNIIITIAVVAVAYFVIKHLINKK